MFIRLTCFSFESSLENHTKHSYFYQLKNNNSPPTPRGWFHWKNTLRPLKVPFQHAQQTKTTPSKQKQLTVWQLKRVLFSLAGMPVSSPMAAHIPTSWLKFSKYCFEILFITLNYVFFNVRRLPFKSIVGMFLSINQRRYFFPIFILFPLSFSFIFAKQLI